MPDKRVTELAAIDAITGTDLVLVIDDPSGTAVSKKATVNQVLVNVARTDVSNTFAGDQTVDGDLFVTGEVNPVVLARQLPKINALSGVAPGDPTGSRTVMSQSLISGLSIRHDEDAGHGKLSVGNYDSQVYQPLLFECETFQVHTGLSPGDRVERLRVHPTGGVTIGADHTLDPGVGALRATYLDIKESLPPPLDPLPDTARLYALDVNGYTQVEMRDSNAKAVRFASDNIIICKVAGVTITRGQCVYLSGATGANPLVGLARADNTATMPTVGLALDTGVVNAFIRVLVAGTLQLLNTAAFAEGDRLYVSPTTAGALTTTQPAAPNYAQRLGFVTRSHATQGEVLVLTTSVDTVPRLHRTTHETGGTDALTALDASILTTGTLPAARLTAANLPTHASRHQSGGADALALDTLAATTDITTLNASSSKHGLLPKLSNVATQYLNGQGAWTVPASGAGDVTGPTSSVNTSLPMFSGTTGNVLADAGVLVNTLVRTNSVNIFTGSPQVISAGSPSPQLRFENTAQAVDAKRWTLTGSGTGLQFEARSDADLIQTTPLQLHRVGDATIGRDVSVTRNATITGSMNVTGAVTLNGTVDFYQQFTQRGTTPGFNLVETDQPANEKNWMLVVGGGVYQLAAFDDSWSPLGTPLRCYRSGAVTIGGLLTVNGFGVHTFSAMGDGNNSINLSNPSSGASASASLLMDNDVRPSNLTLRSTNYNFNDGYTNDGVTLRSTGTGGMAISAQHVSGSIRFFTGGVILRGTIKADGTFQWDGPVQFGSNLTTARLNLEVPLNVLPAILVQTLQSPGGGAFLQFNNLSGVSAGSITHTSATAVAYNTTSDARLKDDLGAAQDLTALRAVVVHDFRWHADGTPDRGIFAQDAVLVFPRAVTVGSDGDDLSRPWGTDYSKFVSDLIVGWQDHDHRLAALEAALKGSLDA